MSRGRWVLYHHPDQADQALVAEAELTAEGLQVERKPDRFVPTGSIYALDCEWMDQPILSQPFALEPPPVNEFYRDMMYSLLVRGSVDLCRIVVA